MTKRISGSQKQLTSYFEREQIVMYALSMHKLHFLRLRRRFVKGALSDAG